VLGSFEALPYYIHTYILQSDLPLCGDDDDIKNNNNNSIQFILCANLTAERPITKRARVEKKTHIQTKYKSKAI
jgi:hypothetical protein